MSYLTTQIVVQVISGGSTGAYLHYFTLMLSGQGHLVLLAQGRRLRVDRLDGAVLLRVLRQRRAGRRGSCCGTRA